MAITYYDDDDDDGPDSAEQSWPWIEAQFAGTKGRREILLRRIRLGALGKFDRPAPLRALPPDAQRRHAQIIADMMSRKNYRNDSKPTSAAERDCARAWPARMEAIRAAEVAHSLDTTANQGDASHNKPAKSMTSEVAQPIDNAANPDTATSNKPAKSMTSEPTAEDRANAAALSRGEISSYINSTGARIRRF